MSIKSYLFGKAPRFAEGKIVPIHLADINGRHYYAFAKELKAPAGGKAVKSKEHAEIISASQIIKQIKEEAGRRITKIAPSWKQQNALADLYLLGGRKDLKTEEQESLNKAHDLLARVQKIRLLSNQIEASFLDGVAVDYLTDKAWEV